MARRHDGTLTAFLVADARLVRFGRSDQDGVRVAFASRVGVRFVTAMAWRHPYFTLRASRRWRGERRRRGGFASASHDPTPKTQTTTATPSTRTSPANWLGRSKREILRTSSPRRWHECKADGSLAAHATQAKLRWQDGYVRHDHSIARASTEDGTSRKVIKPISWKTTGL